MAETRSDINEQNSRSVPRKLVEERVCGTVKWFNVKAGYGFINRSDTHTDIFVHHSAISQNRDSNTQASLRDEEEVEFYVVEGDKGDEASEVMGPNGAPVQGSVFAPSRERWRGSRGFHMQGRGRGMGNMNMNEYYGMQERSPRGRPDMYGGNQFMDRARGRPFRGRGRPRGFGFRGSGSFEPRGRGRMPRSDDDFN